MYTTLIKPDDLAAALAGIEPADPALPLARAANAASDWAVLDCRFDLARPDWGATAYADGHLPGALYAHLDRDLSGPVTDSTGRHPLPARERLAATLGSWGIDERVQVIAYDQGNGAFAARLWWLLRWMGHEKVAVLDGGFAAWQQAGLRVDTTSARREPRTFTPRAGETPVVSTAELESALREGELTSGKSMLVDARAADRFAGQNETIDTVAGHIPGARNHPFGRNVDAQGRFLPAGELRQRWQATLQGTTDAAIAAHTADAAPVIAMCGSGVTACHNLLALEIAGLRGARLYAGSWSEWIRAPQRPVAKGA